MPTYRLHYFPESGNSYKLALMLTLCGRASSRSGPISAAASRARRNGGATSTRWAKSRCWKMDGERLTQTAPILLKLAEQYGRFGGETEQEQFELLRWLFWDNHKLTGYMATYRYNRTFTPSPDEHVQKYFRRRLDDFLSILEAHMQANAFAIGARPTVADISMMAYLHYPRDETGYDFGHQPSRDQGIWPAHGAIAAESADDLAARQAPDARYAGNFSG